MLNAVSHGMVGFQSVASEGSTQGKAPSVDSMRALYRAGRLTVAQALPYAKPSDHGHAVASGKVTIDALIAHGVDIHAATVAYNRATGNGAVSEARKANGPSVASIEAKLLRDDSSDAMRQLVASRQAKRQADKAGKAGKVYTQAEIAALVACGAIK